MNPNKIKLSPQELCELAKTINPSINYQVCQNSESPYNYFVAEKTIIGGVVRYSIYDPGRSPNLSKTKGQAQLLEVILAIASHNNDYERMKTKLDLWTNVKWQSVDGILFLAYRVLT